MATTTTLTAATLVAQIIDQQSASSVLGPLQVISESARNVTLNRDAILALVRRVSDLVEVIWTGVQEPSLREDTAWNDALEQFTRLLDEVLSTLREIIGSNFLRQLLHQERNAARIETLSSRCQNLYSALMLQARIHAEVVAGANAEHAEQSNLPDIIRLRPSPPSRTLLRRVDSPELPCSPSIPPRPPVLFGRSSEASAVVSSLVDNDPAYVAILGGPGMGKTTLSLAVLHDDAVVTKFSASRYFVPFDAISTARGSIALVSRAVGVFDANEKQLRRRLATVLSRRPSLLVLDNFESIWEPQEGRKEAEDLLGLLADISHVSIVVTMRGSERPRAVAWTRPFLPPLFPLSDDAALQTLCALSGIDDSSDARLRTLMPHLGNIPLAVTLMANLAQVETPANLLQRWEDEQTAMLARSKDSNHRSDSLDASIRLSIHSPRMDASPCSLELLRILALLPDGILENDIPLMAPDVSRTSLSVLLQNALVVRSSPDDRAYLLAPVRSFVLANYAPSSTQIRDLAKFYFDLAKLLPRLGTAPPPVRIIDAIAREVGNIGSVLRCVLSLGEVQRPALSAAANLVRLFLLTGIGNIDFLPRALSAARAAEYDDLTAELLCLLANAAPSRCSGGVASYGDPYTSLLEARGIYERLVDMDGIMRTTLSLTPFMPVHEHMGICLQMLELSQTQQNTNMVARSYRALATVCSSRGRLDDARKHLVSALEIVRRREVRDPVDIGVCLLSLANFDVDMGDTAEAKAKIEEASLLLNATCFRRAIATAHKLSGAILLDQGDAVAAAIELAIALPTFREEESYRQTAVASQLLARAYLAQGKDSAALRVVEETEGAAHVTDDATNRGLLLNARADVALWRGDVGEALAVAYSLQHIANTPDNELCLAESLPRLPCRGRPYTPLSRRGLRRCCSRTSAQDGAPSSPQVRLQARAGTCASMLGEDCAEKRRYRPCTPSGTRRLVLFRPGARRAALPRSDAIAGRVVSSSSLVLKDWTIHTKDRIAPG